MTLNEYTGPPLLTMSIIGQVLVGLVLLRGNKYVPLKEDLVSKRARGLLSHKVSIYEEDGVDVGVDGVGGGVSGVDVDNIKNKNSTSTPSNNLPPPPSIPSDKPTPHSSKKPSSNQPYSKSINNFKGSIDDEFTDYAPLPELDNKALTGK